ncbi:MAG: hypothetical protein L0220_05350, partial [Acidobacteria bacterium]|nr:hypothetical protein [Acidobacteriota bacterium]
VALVPFDDFRNGMGAVEAVWIDIVSHLRDFFQITSTLLNLIVILVEQNLNTPSNKVAPDGHSMRNKLMRNLTLNDVQGSDSDDGSVALKTGL